MKKYNKYISILPSVVIRNKVNNTTLTNDDNDNLYFIHLIGYNHYWYYIPTYDVFGLNIENCMEIILKEFSEIYEILKKTSNKFKKILKIQKQTNNR